MNLLVVGICIFKGMLVLLPSPAVLHEVPQGLDGIQRRRVGWQVQRPELLPIKYLLRPPRVVDGQVVEHDDGPGNALLQLGEEGHEGVGRVAAVDDAGVHDHAVLVDRTD